MIRSLFLAWRSGDATATRWGPVGRLDRLDDGYRFVYTRGAKTLEGFQPLPGMPHLDESYESEDLFPLFANRLLDSSRPEYRDSLKWSEFDPDDPPDPIAILAVTEGKRATDSFEVFPCPVRDDAGDYCTKFFLRGLRHKSEDVLERVSKLARDDRLQIRLEDCNEVDPNAVAIVYNGCEIGFVPRYLALDIRELNEACDHMDLAVERINNDAPIQQRLLCRLRSCWPDDFSPCAKDEFQPLASPASRTT